MFVFFKGPFKRLLIKKLSPDPKGSPTSKGNKLF